MNTRWTDADILLAWQLGYDYALGCQPVADANDEIRAAAPLAPAKPTSEVERYLRRIAEFEQCAVKLCERNGYEEWPDAITTKPGSLTPEQAASLKRLVFCKWELRWHDDREPGHGNHEPGGDEGWAERYATHPLVDWRQYLAVPR